VEFDADGGRLRPSPPTRRRAAVFRGAGETGRVTPDPELELELTGLTHGGEAVGRLPDGRACFVAYAIPGERVRVRVVEHRRRWARAEVLAVLRPSPDRVEPPCPYFGPDRCGGCQLQHVSPERQAEMKRQVVVEQLQRVGGIASPPVAATVRPGGSGWLRGYRTSARFAVDGVGRLGFRRAASHAVVPIDRCLLLTDGTQALRDAAGDAWAGAAEVSVRTGSDGAGRAITLQPGPGALPPLPAGDIPVAVVRAGRPVALRGEPAVIEHVAGVAFRVSPTSFFQSGPAGAEALVAAVREAAGAGPGDQALDLYAGVGLFARFLAADGAHVTAVESSKVACDDARTNLRPVRERAAVVRSTAEDAVTRLAASGRTVDIVVLDPPRRGAGPELVSHLARLGARAVVYVSCDPASLARAARALAGAGYRLARAVPVDQFGHTAHIETVATFVPA
jgi:tRNA/tmRNA/rRNA uracil-C5-methylase (TrmA/RlmC/RlmD family)